MVLFEGDSQKLFLNKNEEGIGIVKMDIPAPSPYNPSDKDDPQII